MPCGPGASAGRLDAASPDPTPSPRRAVAPLARWCLLATDAAAVLSTGKEGGIAGCSDLARASQRADAYNRYGADLLRLIDKLPPGHPEREAARAKLRTMRPRALQAMDEVRSLQIQYALQLRDTPTGGMGRA